MLDPRRFFCAVPRGRGTGEARAIGLVRGAHAAYDGRVPGVSSDRSWAPRGAGKRVAWAVLAFFMVFMGVLHFAVPVFFVRAMPPALPWPLELVYVSGVCEIAGGLGLLIPRLRVAAAWGLIALFIAVFPANIHMALDPDAIGVAAPPWIWWARLPLQIPLIATAYWLTRPDGRSAAGPPA